MYVALLILGVILLSAGLAVLFANGSSSGPLFIFMGMMVVNYSKFAFISTQTQLFWVIAVLIIEAINFNRRSLFDVPKLVRRFITGGALAGMVVGLSVGNAGLIVGSAIGAVLGAVAVSRSPRAVLCQGRTLVRCTVEVGIPAVVSMSMLGITLLALMQAR